MIAEKVRERCMDETQLERFATDFASDPRYRFARNAVTERPVHDIALNRDVVVNSDHSFSHLLPSNETTSQQRSGRCWLFAGLNLFRSEAMNRLGVDSFEFSQNYLMFWDKLEKANYFLETILDSLNEASDSRLLMFLLDRPIQDGGQWDMFSNLVKKYGVVPKSAMPESNSSGGSMLMNRIITTKLREFAAELRKSYHAGYDVQALRQRKEAMLTVIYRMLVIHLGEPPRRFHWQWQDRDKNFHRDGELSPQEFFTRYVDYDLDAMVCLIHCPTADKPFEQLYTIKHLGNVLEGTPVRYLNVSLEVFKDAAKQMLVEGQSVWFGCDVGKMLERKRGILDKNLYEYDLVYGEGLRSDKAERLEYGQSLMTHAMVLTGVDISDTGDINKWRVENSWGADIGDKGYMVMHDNWFDEYMYEVLVDKRFVPEALLPVLEQNPVALAPWDPMGALATSE